MTEQELKEWRSRLEYWWKDKLGDLDELANFREFGARQKQNSMQWEPDVAKVMGGTTQGILRTGMQALTAPRAFNKEINVAKDALLAFTETYTSDGKPYEEVACPRLMKCPVCGTNPGRCKDPLTYQERICFSCGRELETL